MGTMIELGEAPFPAYLSTPSGTASGAIILVHEVWGLVEHVKDVADRFAAEGYLVLAPDVLAGTGMTPEIAAELQLGLFNPDPRARNAAQPRLRELMAPIRAPQFAASALVSLRECFDYLVGQGGVGGRIGVVGFCFGGTQSFSLAVHEPRLRAAVPFYGHADFTLEQLRDIRCPVLAFYGERDTGLIEGLPALTRAMGDAGVDFRPQVYPDCGHAFFNDSNPFAYNADAAALAWPATLDFLAETLTGRQ